MRDLLDDPLNEVKAAKRMALGGIGAAVAILVPLYALALGLSVWSLVLVLAPAAAIVLLGIELASRWEYRMRRRYAYPHRLGYELAPVHDFLQACSWGAELLAEWLRAEAVVVAWLTEDGRSLKPIAAHGFHDGWLTEAGTVSVQALALEECVRTGLMPPARPAGASPWFAHLAGHTRVVHVPLVSDNRAQGVVAIAARRGNALVGDRRLLAALGTVMGLALDNCRLYESQKAHANYLQEINRMKSDFLQTVSHELRTPLTSIMVAAEMLLEDEEANDPGGPRARLVSNIVKGAQRLSSLVKDLVDVSREDQFKPRLDLDSVRLADLVASAVGVIQPLAASKHQTVTVEVHSREATVIVDRLRFEQVLINLLSNAQRYSPENGEIKVRTFAEGGETVIAVIDSGPGIAPEDRDLIFEPFYRANRSGLGLGLAIAKSLVELHHGRIRVEEWPGGGSAFVVSLPSQGVGERSGMEAQAAR